MKNVKSFSLREVLCGVSSCSAHPVSLTHFWRAARVSVWSGDWRTQSWVIPAGVIHSRDLLSSSKKQDPSSGVVARLHMLNERVIIPHSRTPYLCITHPRPERLLVWTHLKPAFTGTFIQFWLRVEETFLALNYWGFFCQRFHSWISFVHHPNHSCNPQLLLI